MMRFAFHFVLTLLLLTGMMFAAYRMDRIRPDYKMQNAIYLPKNKQLRKFALGFEGEYADWLWVLSLQKFPKHYIDHIPFDNILEVYQVITDLDPHFREAYRTGALYVAMAKKNSMLGISLLEDGTKKIANQPWIWEFLARMYWLERFIIERQTRGAISREEATFRAYKAICKAVSLKGGERAKMLKQFLELRDRFASFDIPTWVDIYQTAGKNKVLSQIALNRLHHHLLQIHMEFIARQVEQFHAQYKRYPLRLKELKTYLPKEIPEKEMPNVIRLLIKKLSNLYKHTNSLKQIRSEIHRYAVENLGKLANSSSYVYENATGKILSFHLEKQRLSQIMKQVRYKIKHFYKKHQRYPNNLDELTSDIGESLPKLPLNHQYHYKPQQGTISAVSESPSH